MQMIDQGIKSDIVAMFLSGAETGTVLATFPHIGKTTIYALRNVAKTLKDGTKPPAPERPTGVIGDTHIPFTHPRYLEFCKDTFEEYGCGPIVHIGDFWDNHAMSYHESDPDGSSAGDEFLRAMDMAQYWYATFPSVTWLNGNHDNIPMRRVKSAGLSKRVLRENIYRTPEGWINRESIIINDVHYSHGIGMAGVNGHRNHAISQGMSAVMGHCHSFGGTSYVSNPYQIMFGLNVGCGIDIEAYAMEYSRHFVNRPTLGCGIVFSREKAMFVPMNLNRYSRHK